MLILETFEFIRLKTRFVIPAKAGIQSFKWVMDSRFRGSDRKGAFFKRSLL
jgi:hypothetical protein